MFRLMEYPNNFMFMYKIHEYKKCKQCDVTKYQDGIVSYGFFSYVDKLLYCEFKYAVVSKACL